MPLEELKAWERAMQKEAEEYLYSIGQPVVYEKDGQMVAQHSNEPVHPICNISDKEFRS
jgi:hypothetical protein